MSNPPQNVPPIQWMICDCGKQVNALRYAQHIESGHVTDTYPEPMSTPAPTQNVKLITCSCGAVVDAMKYADHVRSEHKLHVIQIQGVGATMIPPQPASPQTIKFLDIPYIGRVRRDGFVIYTLLMIVIGVLLAAYH